MTRASRSPDLTAGDIVGWAWLLVSAGVSCEIGLLRCPRPCASHRLDGRPRSPGVPSLRGVGAPLLILRPAQPWTSTVIPADAISARGRRRVAAKLRDREHWPPGRVPSARRAPGRKWCVKSSIGLPVAAKRTNSHSSVTVRDVRMPRADDRVLSVNHMNMRRQLA